MWLKILMLLWRITELLTWWTRRRSYYEKETLHTLKLYQKGQVSETTARLIDAEIDKIIAKRSAVHTPLP
jgi:hypothetical protein